MPRVNLTDERKLVDGQGALHTAAVVAGVGADEGVGAGLSGELNRLAGAWGQHLCVCQNVAGVSWDITSSITGLGCGLINGSSNICATLNDDDVVALGG